MTLTTEETAQCKERISQLMREINELTGGAPALLLLEVHNPDGTWGIREWRNGSPYATARMAQIYHQQDNNDDLATVLANTFQPPDDSDSWKD